MRRIVKLLAGLAAGFAVIIAAAPTPAFEHVFVAATAAMLVYALYIALKIEKEAPPEEPAAKKVPMVTKSVKAGLGIVLPLDKVLIVNYDPPFVFIPLEYIIDYLEAASPPPPAPRKEEKKKREEVIESVVEALSRK